MNRPPLLSPFWLYAVLMILVLGSGLWLATDRIFQVDEIQNMHMSWLLTQRDAANFYSSAELYMIPLAALFRWCKTPVAFLMAGRVIFFVLFVTSLGLVACGLSGKKRPGVAGATLLLLSAPIFWDHGFEVRHDNIVVLGLGLLILLLFRGGNKRGPRDLFWGGFIGGGLLLCSLKSIVLWAPILAYMVGLQWRRDHAAGLRALAASLAGFSGSLAVGLMAHGLQGSLRIYLEGLGDFGKTLSTGGIRFFDWAYLWRFVAGHPLITLASVLFLLLYGVPAGRRWAKGDIFRDDDRRAKELLLLLTGIVFLAVNPTPFPYNYLYVALLASPAAYALMARALRDPGPMARLLAYGLIAFQGLAWATQVPRHFAYRNEGQKRVIEFLNAYTNAGDRVFDGVGLAIDRKGPARDWYLHSLSRPRYIAGEIRSVREILASSGCPVLVESYKWQYMLPEDLAFIRSNYISHGGLIWVLGTKVVADSPGAHVFDVPKGGHYLISPPPGPRLSTMLIDGVAAGTGSVYLEKGRHILVTDSAVGTVDLEWVKGPGALKVKFPSISEPIFTNWY